MKTSIKLTELKDILDNVFHLANNAYEKCDIFDPTKDQESAIMDSIALIEHLLKKEGYEL